MVREKMHEYLFYLIERASKNKKLKKEVSEFRNLMEALGHTTYITNGFLQTGKSDEYWVRTYLRGKEHERRK